MMTVSLVEFTLLTNLFSKNKERVSATVSEFHRINNLRRGPMSINGILSFIMRFKKTWKLEVKHGRGCKYVTPVFIDSMRAAVDVQ